jgi:hypothetical protein
MSKIQKAIDRFRQNDRNVRFDEMDTLLIHLGFERRSRGSSHFVYKMEGVPNIIIPFRKPFLLPIYVKNIIEIIDEYLEEQE